MKFKSVLLFAFYWSLPAFTLFSVGVASAKDFNDGEVIHIEYPAWFIDSPFYDLAEVVSEAGSNGKKGLMVLFTTQGCSYCSAFIDRSLGNPGIAKLVQENFDSIGMEIFDDVGMVDPVGKSISIKQFAKLEGAEYSPTLLFFDNTGKRVLRVIGYQNPQRFRVILDYIIGNHYQAQSLRDYYQGLAKSGPDPSAYRNLKEDPLFIRPPYMLDRSRSTASKPLLVVFEKTGCEECADFHKDVLALNEVRELLEKFQVVRLDANDGTTKIKMPDGSESTPASWFRETNFTRVPALIFFDEKGNKVQETDALVRRQRMINSVNFVLERAYEKDWTYQRFARSKGIERSLKKMKEEKQ
ncbi:thioredoxin family protein [Kaarinaea lacus]